MRSVNMTKKQRELHAKQIGSYQKHRRKKMRRSIEKGYEYRKSARETRSGGG